MKNSTITSTNYSRCFSCVVMFILFGTLLARADSCFTNFDGLEFGLKIAKTNYVVGETVMASMVVSNMLDQKRMIPWATGNPCSTGFGEYFVVDIKSGQQKKCVLDKAEQHSFVSQSLGIFDGHEGQVFDHDLALGYGITNTGIYLVQASGRFQFAGDSNRNFTLTTPPLIIFVLPKTERPKN